MRFGIEPSEIGSWASSWQAAPANDNEPAGYARARRINEEFIGVLDDLQQLAVLRAIFSQKRSLASAPGSGI